MITVVFNPTGTANAVNGAQGVRNAVLHVTAGGVTQNVALTAHDSIATTGVSAITPVLNPATPNVAAVTGTITVTNTSTRCDVTPTNLNAPGGCSTTGIPAGYPAPSFDAGPYVIAGTSGPANPNGISINRLTGTGTWAVAGTCAAGTAINPGLAGIVPGPIDPATGQPVPPGSTYVPSGSCTVTVTYTPPATCTATATATCTGTARLIVTGYGTAASTGLGTTAGNSLIYETITAN
ncbi:MAG: hypothetical protein JO347_01305 [Candidatus Eremiobacteraeota bacterium]|nr:hypothetical protein [Candidatus Eremiobacteraeota bacterium]